MVYTEDILGRALCPFIVLDETAKQMQGEGDSLSGDTIYLGIQKKHLTKEVLSTFRTLTDWEMTKKGNRHVIEFEKDGAKVEILIIRKKWEFLRFMDFVFYRSEEYHIPNPFDKYWKSRFFLR